MNKLLSFCIALFVSLAATQANAQDSAFDELTMNGLASFQKLRKEYYIGALFLESSQQNADEITNTPGNKRMEIRIVVDKWSPRRFSKEWTGSILLNNEQAALENLTTQIQSFTNIPKNDLVKGDRITIDMAEGRHTTIYLNNHRVFRTINNKFFYVLLNAWIGSKPPSTEFKQNILKLMRDDKGVELLTRYEELNYEDSRKSQIMSWSKAAAGAGVAAASSAFAPPGSGSTKATSSSSAAANQKAEQEAKAAAAKKAAEDKAQAEALAKAQSEKEAAEAKAAAAAEELRKAKAEQAHKEAMGKYQSDMFRLIAKNVKYPKRSQQRGERGRVVVKVELDREGKIVNLSREESTPFSRLNSAAEKAFKVSEPFAPMPDEVEGKTFEFIFPINF